MSFISNYPNMPDMSSYMDLINSTLPQSFLQSLAMSADGEGPSLESMMTDSVALTDQAAATARDQASGRTENLDKFSQYFTKDDLASLFGVDAGSLTDEQAKNLTELLFNLNEVNAERAANGEEPLSNDEINQYLSGEIEKFKNGEESPLGKTLNELGIEKLSDEQFGGINQALGNYNAAAAEEAAKAQEAQEAQANNNVNNGNDAGKTTDKKDSLPEKLDDLQQLKSKEEGELGNLKNELAGKKSELNELKGKLAEDALGQNASEDEANSLKAYNDAKTEYSAATSAKQEAQKELTLTEQKSCQNEQDLCSNAQQRSKNDSELFTAQSKLASLQAPAAPSGDDPDGKAKGDYDKKLQAYNEQKSQLEAQIEQLKQKQTELKTKQQELETEKQNLAQAKAANEAEIQTQDALLQDAQGRMDEAMEALQKNENVKKALDSSQELKKLEADVAKLEKQVSEKEAYIGTIDAKISKVESQDLAVAAMREEEADKAFQETAKAAGFDIEGDTAKAQEDISKEKYGKPYSELNELEKQSIEMEVDGRVTASAMDQAKNKLNENPEDEEAKAALEGVLTDGQKSLEAQSSVAFCEYAEAYKYLPAALKDDAEKAAVIAMDEAIGKGEDGKLAYFDTLAKALGETAGKEGLKPEVKAAMQEIAGKTGDYAASLQRVNEGESVLVEAGLAEAKPVETPNTEQAAEPAEPAEGKPAEDAAAQDPAAQTAAADGADDEAAIEADSETGENAGVKGTAWEGVDLVQGAEDRQAYIEQMNAAYSAPLLEQGWKMEDVKGTGYDMVMRKGDLVMGVKWGEVGTQKTEMLMHGDGDRPVTQKGANPFADTSGESNLIVFQMDLKGKDSSQTSQLWSKDETTQKACEAVRPFIEHGGDVALSCHSSGGYGGCNVAAAVLNGQAGEMKDDQNFTLRLYDAVPRTGGEQKLDALLSSHPMDFNLEIYSSTQGKAADEKKASAFMRRVTSDEEFLALCQQSYNGGSGGLSITGVTRVAGEHFSEKYYNVKYEEYDCSHGKLKNWIAEGAGFSHN